MFSVLSCVAFFMLRLIALLANSKYLLILAVYVFISHGLLLFWFFFAIVGFLLSTTFVFAFLSRIGIIIVGFNLFFCVIIIFFLSLQMRRYFGSGLRNVFRIEVSSNYLILFINIWDLDLGADDVGLECINRDYKD